MISESVRLRSALTEVEDRSTHLSQTVAHSQTRHALLSPQPDGGMRSCRGGRCIRSGPGADRTADRRRRPTRPGPARAVRGSSGSSVRRSLHRIRGIRTCPCVQSSGRSLNASVMWDGAICAGVEKLGLSRYAKTPQDYRFLNLSVLMDHGSVA